VSNTGVDIEPIATFTDLAAKQAFITRNFTPKEIAYVRDRT
jgi:phosphopantetheinyl transferase (holo-ACP synthase)